MTRFEGSVGLDAVYILDGVKKLQIGSNGRSWSMTFLLFLGISVSVDFLFSLTDIIS